MSPLTNACNPDTLCPTGLGRLEVALLFAVTFGSAWLLFALQDLVWQPRVSMEGARSLPTAALQQAEEIGSRIGTAFVAPGGIPVPVATRQYFPRSKKGRFGISFQGVYESGLSPRQVIAYYQWHLSHEGWGADLRTSALASKRGKVTHLIFLRAAQRLSVSLYPVEDRERGCDFRLSLISRPPRHPVGAIAPPQRE